MQQLPPPAAWARVRDYLGWAGLPPLAALSLEWQLLLSRAGQGERFPCPALCLTTEAEGRLFRKVWTVCATARVDVPRLRLNAEGLQGLGDQKFPGLRVQRLELAGAEVTNNAVQRAAGAFPVTSHLELYACTLLPNGACLANLPSGLESLCLEDCKGLTNGQMKSLPVSLRHLHIRRCGGITALVGLEALSGLQVLHLESCTGLVDEGLRCLPGLKGLAELSLRGCSQLTDAVLQFVAKATGLQRLDLSQCKLLTSAGVQSLGALQNLQGLDLRHCYALRDGALAFLRNLRQLRQLNVHYCYNLTGQALLDPELVLPESLQQLNLGELQVITTEQLQELKDKLPHLEELGLGDCKWLIDAMLPLLPPLRRLVICDCNSLNNEGLSGLPAVQELNLSLSSYWLTDAGLENLKQAKEISSLRRLDLSHCLSITAYGLNHLPVSLRWLSLRGSRGILPREGHRWQRVDGRLEYERVPDEKPGQLQLLRDLEELDLSPGELSKGSAIADAVLTSLGAPHLSLWKLDLSYYRNITDEKLEQLPKNLRWLSLRGCPGLTAEEPGLTAKGLAQLPLGLEELDLSECNWLTDAGLKSLYRHYRLRCLRLEHCDRVTRIAVQALLRALPGLQVETVPGERPCARSSFCSPLSPTPTGPQGRRGSQV